MTFKQLAELYCTLKKTVPEMTDPEFNAKLLELVRSGTLSETVFLEYLECTQVDINEVLENYMEGVHEL